VKSVSLTYWRGVAKLVVGSVANLSTKENVEVENVEVENVNLFANLVVPENAKCKNN